MQISVAVGVLVMPPVMRHPSQHGASCGHRSRNDQCDPHSVGCGERAVREKAVKAHRLTQSGHQPHCQEQADTNPTDVSERQKYESRDRGDRRQNVEQQKMMRLKMATGSSGNHGLILLG
jgi:hypothetical protein